MNAASRLTIRSTHAAAVVDLDGGRLASLTVHGMELLVTAVDDAHPMRWGSYPMVPWCGRMADGVLTHGDATHTFEPDDGPNAIHGFVRHRPWRTRAAAPSTPAADLTITVDLDDPWPWAGTVTQSFTIDDTRLRIEMTVAAQDDAFPAQLGWHPWFRRELDRGGPLRLAFAADHQLEKNEVKIPTGRTLPVGAGPWDDTFTGFSEQPEIVWPDALTLQLRSGFDHWVIFTEPAHAIAVEPQSGAPNDINRAPHIVRPGEPLTGWMELRWP